MKELTCAFVFTLMSLVTATPHGYGVKGGASAKAEASAVAGSFDGLGAIPLSVPTGAGYSGSFSKSSSSSFASSSASSSSSSSAFSFSGSGAAGVTGSGSKTTGGCTSGNCHVGGADGIGAHGVAAAGSGSQSFAGAKGTAVAGTDGIEKIGTSPTGCVSGNCQSGITNGATSNSAAISGTLASDYNKDTASNRDCTSGTCHNDGDAANKATNNLHNSASSGNGDGQAYGGTNSISATGPLAASTKYPKGSSSCANGDCSGKKSECLGSSCDNNAYDNDKICASGHCGSTSQTNDGVNDIHVNIAGSKTKYDSKGQSSSSGFDSSASDCAYGNCGPSVISYSKPVYTHGSSTTYPGSSPFGQNQHPSNSFLPHIPSTENGAIPAFNKVVPATHLTTPKESPQGTSCITPNCGSPDSTSYSTKLPSSYNVPIHGSYPSTSSENKDFICTTGKCNSQQPSASYSPSNGNSLSTNYLNTVSGTKCATPNCATITYGTDGLNAPINSQIPVYQVISVPSGINDCASGNCGVYPSSQANIPVSKIPSHIHVGSKVPIVATGPSSCVPGSPNCNGIHSTVINQPPQVFNVPSYSHTALPSFNVPSPDATDGSSSTVGTFGSSKPVATGNQKIPIYTGGFGGPSGLLKPNDYSVPAEPGHTQHQPALNPSYPSGGVSVPSSPINVPASNYYDKPSTPTADSNIASCTSSNCGSQIGHTGAQAGAGAVANADTVAYSGGFGGPPGLLQPFDAGKVATGHGHADLSGQHLTGSQLGFSHGSSAAGGSPSENDANTGANKGGFGGPPGLLQPYDTGKVATGHGHAGLSGQHLTGSQLGFSHGSSAAGGSPSENDANTVANKGGFGGPPGLLQPYDTGKVTTGGQAGLSGHQLTGSQLGFSHGSSAAGGVHSANSAETGANNANSGAQAAAAAQATAVAGTNSLSLDKNTLQGGSKHANEHQVGSACGGGCGSNGASYGDNGAAGLNFGVGGGFGLGAAKTGILDGLSGVLSGANAAAKSVAGAVSGATASAGSFGLGGGFASSGAVAHASSGAATKGGYGR